MFLWSGSRTFACGQYVFARIALARWITIKLDHGQVTTSSHGKHQLRYKRVVVVQLMCESNMLFDKLSLANLKGMSLFRSLLILLWIGKKQSLLGIMVVRGHAVVKPHGHL